MCANRSGFSRCAHTSLYNLCVCESLCVCVCLHVCEFKCMYICMYIQIYDGEGGGGGMYK